MNERIKEARKALALSQEKFAAGLNMTQNYIALLETGKRGISDRTINDICRTYNINEEWLRTGTGDMFISPTMEDEILIFASEVLKLPENDPRVRIMRMLAQLPVEDWHAVTDMLDLLDEQKKSAGNAADQ